MLEWFRGRCSTCREFERVQWVLVDEVSRIVGTGVAGGIWKSVQRG